MKVSYPNLPPGISKIAIGFSFMNASGAQSITGLGFKPKIVLFKAIGVGGVNQVFSEGWDNGVQHHNIYGKGQGVDVTLDVTRSIHIEISAGNQIVGYISSMDGDGFTITWTLTGIAEANFTYLAMR